MRLFLAIGGKNSVMPKGYSELFAEKFVFSSRISAFACRIKRAAREDEKIEFYHE